ncbi:MAG: LptF/LptG family permease, partial [Pseudanabaena sp.]
FMVYSFPMSMLLATLLSYSRMSGDGETTALRSCGVSAYRLVLPALVLSLFVTGMTYVFNEAIVLRQTGNHAVHYEQLSIKKISNLKNKILSISNMVIYHKKMAQLGKA